MRRFYSFLIQRHPRQFREQFGTEMMAIFDQTSASRLPLMGDAVASLFRQWAFRPRPRVPESAPVVGAPVFVSLESYRMRSGALVHGGFVSAALFAMVIFLIDHPGRTPQWLIGMHRAAESLIPMARPAFDEANPTTEVRLPEQAKDPWMKIAIAYFKYMPVMKALDLDGDHIISGKEMVLAPAILRSFDRNNDGKLDGWECGATAGVPAAFIRLNPVLAVVDMDRDGELSAGEIRYAAEALQTLDRNGDGNLRPEEYLPHVR